jgi:hypothetical protein
MANTVQARLTGAGPTGLTIERQTAGANGVGALDGRRMASHIATSAVAEGRALG